jgi:hypothetical protein
MARGTALEVLLDVVFQVADGELSHEGLRMAMVMS